jgi:hypothetical protein
VRPQTAILILAHRPAALASLLRLLDHRALANRFRLFIHIDAKTDYLAAGLRLPPHVTLITPRLPVFWGGWSMIRATLALIDAARGYQRMILISGDALPVRPLSEIDRLMSDLGTEYIELLEVQDDPSLAGVDPLRAIERYGWVQPWRRYNHVFWDHPLLNPMQSGPAAARYGVARTSMDWIRGEAEHLVRDILAEIPPRAPLFERFYYGAQWWALTGATIDALLPSLHDPEIQRHFRHMQVPDEHMIQTILGNAPHLMGGRKLLGTPMFADHARRAGGDDTLDVAGFQSAAVSAQFARKFNPETAPDIAEAIAEGGYWQLLENRG